MGRRSVTSRKVVEQVEIGRQEAERTVRRLKNEKAA
jgi:hypothetical protein